ncbi:unnamed protein product [Meloidogyne enterolobii]|uniref:Uncharacterized protein n=1 Tax=Meloidogyne enterolobii TaxID=390850 RepID=A0ACB0ZSQ9_MELEN
MQKKTSFKSIIFWFKNLFKGKKKKEEEKNILNKFNKFGCFEFKWLGKLKKNLVGKKKIKLGKKGGGRVKRFVENKEEYFNELIRERRDNGRKYERSNSSSEEEEEVEVEVEEEEEDENEGEEEEEEEEEEENSHQNEADMEVENEYFSEKRIKKKKNKYGNERYETTRRKTYKRNSSEYNKKNGRFK